MMNIDEAPPGYIAVPEEHPESCIGCDYKPHCKSKPFPCSPGARRDGKFAVFKRVSPCEADKRD